MSPDHCDTGVYTYTVFVATCQKYDGRYFISSGLISPNVPFTLFDKCSDLQSTVVYVNPTQAIVLKVELLLN